MTVKHLGNTWVSIPPCIAGSIENLLVLTMPLAQQDVESVLEDERLSGQEIGQFDLVAALAKKSHRCIGRKWEEGSPAQRAG